MLSARFRMKGIAIFATATLALSMTATPTLARSAAPTSGRELSPTTRFFVPTPDKGALQQIVSLVKTRHINDAYLIGQMIATPQAVWFTSGTPAEVKKAVQKTVFQAAIQRSVPILVVYNVPGRDCAQYSAGGAATGDAYKAWIDAFAAGLGKTKAVVILEPDGLALLPTDCGQPDTYDRVGLIAYAGSKIDSSDLNASVYLDAGHSNWHSVGDMASRLVAGGVMNVQGFFLNASNYQYTANLVQYGTWISKCIASSFSGCANIYWNGGPAGTVLAGLIDPSTGVPFGASNGVTLSAYGEWSDTTTVPALNTSGINAQLAGVVPATHFVIDTSRNGQGPWNWAAEGYASAGAAQDWCNPPGRGLGLRPTTNTGNDLVDAYLWVKIPGESDGACTRDGSAGTQDPERGIVDPAAGDWFPQQALELAKLANPPLKHLH